MVKDMRYILKKIIIGVGIALAIMSIKTNVFALEYQKGYGIRIAPNGICYTPAGSSTTCTTPSVYNNSVINNYVYGKDLSYSGYGGTTFYIPVNGAVDNTAFDNAIGDLTFVYVSRSSSGNADPTPLNFVVTGVTRNVSYSCYNDSSLFTHDNSTMNEGEYWHFRQYTSVRCPNVPLDQDYRITQSASSFISGVMGITPATWALSISDNSSLETAINNNTNAVNNQTDTIKSEDSPDTEGFLSELEQDDSDSPVSDLITMPITLLQALNNNSSGSCSTWNLGSLFNHNLTMPCINLSNILGSTLYNLIDMAICLFLAYNLGLMCVTIYNNLTSLKDDFDDMYSPQHAYQPKHGGGS